MSPTWGGLGEPESWSGGSEEQNMDHLVLAAAEGLCHGQAALHLGSHLWKSSITALLQERAGETSDWLMSKQGKAHLYLSLAVCCWGLFPLVCSGCLAAASQQLPWVPPDQQISNAQLSSCCWTCLPQTFNPLFNPSALLSLCSILWQCSAQLSFVLSEKCFHVFV